MVKNVFMFGHRDCPEGVDGTIYPPEMEFVPKRLAIIKASEFELKFCNAAICYMWHPASNTRKLLDKAKSSDIFIHNLAGDRLSREK